MLQDQRTHARLPTVTPANGERVAGHLESFDQIREKTFGDCCDDRRDPSARKAVASSFGQPFALALSSLAKVQNHPTRFNDYFNALRPQHWLKNLLVFVPLFVLPGLYEPVRFGRAVIVFMAFCCCASSGYLVNDLCDLAADHRHPKKRFRPLASGRVGLTFALTVVPILIVLSCVLGLLVAPLVVGVLLLYYALTLIYSVCLKRVVLLDVIVLSVLYTLRIVAGAAAVRVWPLAWLFVFSIFLFLSLALAKRYVELAVMQDLDGDHARARGYGSSDAGWLASNGTASGYMAVLTFALYVMSSTLTKFNGRHEIIWFLCPLLLYWVDYMWLAVHRRTVDDDPFVFALRDRTSRTLILLMTATTMLAM